MKRAEGRFERSTLPAEEASRTICCPTRGRWRSATGESPGDLGHWLHSVASRLEAEGIAEESRIVIGDQTLDCSLESKAANISWAIHHSESPVVRRPEIFLQDLETRTEVADRLRERLRPPERILENFLLRSGYAQSRIATELPLLGRVLSMDDDTTVPEEAPFLEGCDDLLPGPSENSQVLHRSNRFSELGGRISMRPNRIGPIFEPIGRTVGALRNEGWGTVPVSNHRHNTMHEAFDRLSRLGDSSRFAVDHAETTENGRSKDVEIAAVAITEYGLPDFRTVAMVDSTIANHGKPIEHRTISAGENRLFAFRGSESHVSSCLARWLCPGLDHFPWWFLTDDRISLRNPHRTVRTSYRSDNELVADLLQPLSAAISRPLAYGQGVPTRVLHRPATAGHRPDLPEQAAASLVGAMIAGEVKCRLQFNGNGEASLPEIPDSYELPDEAALAVFEQLESLAVRCRRVADSNQRESNTASWCRAMAQDLGIRLAGFDFQAFKASLEVETREQLRFQREVLTWYPRIRRFVIDEMVLAGRYPVMRYIG
ncbi:MAG: hypothetical protein P8I74_03175 [Phycisphaerales bacterium]|nr:hypothetical protein [Phycisphaerales bacterium]